MKTLQLCLLVVGGLVSVVSGASAKSCAITVRGNDQMQFDQSTIHLDAQCTQVVLTLIHTGTLAADVMGHNWVLTRPEDLAIVAQAGECAGIAQDYVAKGDPHVIAHTRLIGGGQQTQITFSTHGLHPGQPYTYFCSFPGHWSVMQGTLFFNQ